MENLQLNNSYDDHQCRIDQIEEQIFGFEPFQTNVRLPEKTEI